MRVKHRPPRTNGEVDAFIAERWHAGDNAHGIKLELMWRGTKLSRERIMAGVKRHIDANSENAGFGKKRRSRGWMLIALPVLQALVAIMLCGWLLVLWW